MNVSFINTVAGCTTINDFTKLENKSCNSIYLFNIINQHNKDQLDLLLNLVKEKLTKNGKLYIQSPDLQEAALFLISAKISLDDFNNLFISNNKYVYDIGYLENKLKELNMRILAKDIDGINFLMVAYDPN